MLALFSFLELYLGYGVAVLLDDLYPYTAILGTAFRGVAPVLSYSLIVIIRQGIFPLFHHFQTS